MSSKFNLVTFLITPEIFIFLSVFTDPQANNLLMDISLSSYTLNSIDTVI